MPSCAIITCRKRSQVCSVSREGISFHRFPPDPDIRILWIEATGRIEWIPTKCSTICSTHFTEDDFDITKQSGKKYLKPGATPHINIVYVKPLVPSIESNRDTVTQAASSVDEITNQNNQKLLSPTNASTPTKRKLQNIISIKESIIKRQKLKIKRVQAQNRRLKRKVNNLEDILVNIHEKFSLNDEETNILTNIIHRLKM